MNKLSELNPTSVSHTPAKYFLHASNFDKDEEIARQASLRS